MSFIMNGTQEDTITQKLLFSWLDYTTFALMLLIPAIIGIYFGCFGSRQKSVIEYLLGGKDMSVLPVAMSLIASSISGITLLGVPSEMYVYGTQYWLICVALVIVGIAFSSIYLPVFHKLQLTSSFKYLQLRFNRNVCIMASAFYTVTQILFLPIVVYIPALAFSQVSGVNLHLVTPVLSCICIFYTTLGGIKAVIWTDFIQQMIVYGSSIAIMFIGLKRVNGFSNMWHINEEGQRIEFFNMDPSIFARFTFFTTVIGFAIHDMARSGINQACVQRFLAVPSIQDAQLTMILFIVGMIVCKSISCVTGLLIYAQYHDCDPLTTKAIKHQDQLLPFYVMDIAGHIPGLPGLFLAGVFSGALSTMSTCLNTISGTMYEDFISPYLPQRKREKHAIHIMKVIVLIIGILSIILIFLIEKLGAVVQMTVSLASITFGALFGLFSLGMLCPWANAVGALTGGLTSLVFMGIIVVGNQAAVSSKQIIHPKKPISVEGCFHHFNATVGSIDLSKNTQGAPFALFRISFVYFTTIGVLIVLIVGVVVSWFTHPNKIENINRDLLSPVIHRWLPKEKPQEESFVDEPLLFSDK